jgi:hypothetical protein
LALNTRALENLRPYLKGSVLSLGYPDLIAKAATLQEIFKSGDRETKAAFERIGCTLRCVDFYRLKGVDKVVDLNEPVDLGKYDLVIDPGTIEHCFNVAQAFKNAAQAVKVGGFIFHIGSLSMVNHAFYSFSPTLFPDFYGANGFELVMLQGSHKDGVPIPIHPYQRMKIPEECVIHCIARKVEEKETRWPIQWKYRKQYGDR